MIVAESGLYSDGLKLIEILRREHETNTNWICLIAHFLHQMERRRAPRRNAYAGDASGGVLPEAIQIAFDLLVMRNLHSVIGAGAALSMACGGNLPAI